MNEENTKDTIEDANVVTDEVITPDEVLPPEALQVLKDSRIAPNDATKLRTMFNDMFSDAEKYIDMAYKIKVTDISQKPEMKLAGTVRSSIRKVRTTADKKRKEAGEDARLWTGAVNGMFNVLKAMALPAEAHLEKQEKFAERYEAEQKDQLRKAREIALEPYSEVITSDGMDLSAMTQEGFDNLVNGAKLQIEAKKKEAEEAETLRIAEEKRIEDERIEAERVAEEARQKEIVEANERARVAEEARIEAEKVAEIERVARETKEAIAKEEREAKAEVEREEREVADKKAKAEKAKVDAEAKRLKKIADDATAETARLKKIADDAKAKQDKAEADLEASNKKASQAPDKEKIVALADDIGSVNLPEMSSESGKLMLKKIGDQHEKYVIWIRECASKL